MKNTLVLMAAFGLTGLAAALEVGEDLQVMWDDHVVDTARTTAPRVMHRPRCADKVLDCDAPWEGDASGWISVFRDGDVCRMYYLGGMQGCTHAVPPAITNTGDRLCYAESRDGIHWTKPTLGLVDFNGSTSNNILIAGLIEPHYVFKDQNPACPAGERYKEMGEVGDRKRRLGFRFSADPLRFDTNRFDRIVEDAGNLDSLNLAFWDATRNRYYCYLRDFHPTEETSRFRDVRVMTSPDFVTWTRPEPIRFAAGKKPFQLYTNGVGPYFRNPKIFIGFPTRYQRERCGGRDSTWTANYDRLPDAAERKARMGTSKRYAFVVTDGLFMMSRNGIDFDRTDEAFFPPGPEAPGGWVYGDGYPSPGILLTKAPQGGADEMSFYLPRGFWSGRGASIWRYTLRQDGFFSRQAPYAGARVVTKPLKVPAGRMLVNFSTSGGGWLRVSVRDAAGAVIDSVEMFGDAVDAPVPFADGGLAAFEGRTAVLTFEMSDADLYSFRFRR